MLFLRVFTSNHEKVEEALSEVAKLGMESFTVPASASTFTVHEFVLTGDHFGRTLHDLAEALTDKGIRAAVDNVYPSKV